MKRPALVRFIAFLGVLAVLLGYVAYHKAPAPVSASTSPGVATNTTSLANYFANYRKHRDDVMAKEISTLQALVKTSGVSKAARSQAQSTLVQDQQQLKQAMQIEGILGAHGFALVAATVQPNSVVIMVGAKSLTTNQVAQIADTATQVTGLPPQDIVIVPKSTAS